MAKLTGTNPDQVPTNADLGTMAYQDANNVKIGGVSYPSSDGTNGQVLSTNGSGTLSFADAGGGGLQSVQVFTSSGTWTKPSGVTKVKVTVVGGGGGGEASNGGGNGGGGAGACIELIDVSAVSSVSVTVGAGGAGGNMTGTTDGADGGTSSFGAYLSATGGTGGANGTNDYGQGGSGSGGDINFQGQNAGAFFRENTGNDIPGSGGDSILGYGGPHQTPATSGGGFDGRGYGAGGSGVEGTFENQAGDGSGGIVIVEEYA